MIALAMGWRGVLIRGGGPLGKFPPTVTESEKQIFPGLIWIYHPVGPCATGKWLQPLIGAGQWDYRGFFPETCSCEKGTPWASFPELILGPFNRQQKALWQGTGQL